MAFNSHRLALLAAAALFVPTFASSCGDGQSEIDAAVSRYHATLRDDMANLAVKTDALATQIEEGDLGKAQSRYATSRVRYSRVEPIVEALFDSLDLRIDGYADEVEPGSLAGFHAIERTLWRDEETVSLAPVARRLHADIEELRSGVMAAELNPAVVARGANELIANLPAEMLAGEIEPYADCDLVDVAANVEGAEAAFEAVKPILEERDPALATDLEARFRRALSALDEHGTLFRDPEQSRAAAPGASFAIYSEISRAERRKLARAIDALASPLARAATEVADDSDSGK
jgi:iron uptake system component EfeO